MILRWEEDSFDFLFLLKRNKNSLMMSGLVWLILINFFNSFFFSFGLTKIFMFDLSHFSTNFFFPHLSTVASLSRESCESRMSNFLLYFFLIQIHESFRCEKTSRWERRLLQQSTDIRDTDGLSCKRV